MDVFRRCFVLIFVIFWNLSRSCCEAEDVEAFLNVGEKVTITTKGFPGNYENDQSERWQFTSENGFFVNFIFFETESYDNVVISFGPDNETFTGIMVLNGDDVDVSGIYVFTETVLTIAFDSDSSVVFRGFQAEIEGAPDASSIKQCDGWLLHSEDICDKIVNCGDFSDEKDCPLLSVGDTISLQSKNYPERYPNNNRQTWFLQVEGSASLRFELIYFVLSEYYDILTIESNISLHGDLISAHRELRGSLSDNVFFTHGDTLVSFTTGYYVPGFGLNIEVTVVEPTDTSTELCFYGDQDQSTDNCQYKTRCEDFVFNQCHVFTDTSEGALIASPGYPFAYDNIARTLVWIVVGPADTRIVASIEAAWLVNAELKIGYGYKDDDVETTLRTVKEFESVKVSSPANTLTIVYKKKQESYNLGFIAHVTSVTDVNVPEYCDDITETIILPADETLRQIVQNRSCLWTGIYKMPDTASQISSVIRLDLMQLKGVDGLDNFVAVGEGMNPDDTSSVLFNHSNIHLAYDFHLQRLNIQNGAIWIQIHQPRVYITLAFNISLSQSAQCEDGQFTCDDGHCIGSEGVTNGLPDCLDGADEDERFGFRDCIGTPDFTSINFTTNPDCLPWDSVDLLKTRGLPVNFCRHIGLYNVYPFCFTYSQYYDSLRVSDACAAPHCFDRMGCYYGNGEDYQDMAHYTENGFQCIYWSDVPTDLLNDSVSLSFDFPDNFCRNPNSQTKPWCFYQSAHGSVEWNFCQVDQCSSPIFANFRRYPMSDYIDEDQNFNSNALFHTEFFTEEDCANECMTDVLVECRSFVFDRVTSPDQSPGCRWSAATPNNKGVLGSLEPSERYDLFVRIDTECEPFYDDELPGKCTLPVTLSSDFVENIETGINDTSNLYNTLKYSQFGLDSCWMPDNFSQPLQLNLGERYLISAIIVSGCVEENLGWVSALTIESDVHNYRHVDIDSQSDIFKANVESRCSVRIPLHPVIRASTIRINPVSYHIGVAMKVDLIGCRDNDCDESLGTNMAVPDSAITGSSALSVEHLPTQSRLQLFEIRAFRPLGWIPAAEDAAPWLKISYKRLTVLRDVIIQGCKNKESWVTSFQMSYSADEMITSERDYYWIRDGDSEITQMFTGNVDSTSPQRIKVGEINLRHLRIHPKTWNGEACMKFELLGCPYRVCYQRLGMESGDIQSNQIDESNVCKQNGEYRLFWNPLFSIQSISEGEDFRTDTVTIDLLEDHVITAIATQGTGTSYATYATSYRLLYRRRQDRENTSWKTYLNLDGTAKEFEANFDASSVVINELDRPLIASQVQIEYWHFEDGKASLSCVRVELFGCNYEDSGNVCGSNTLEIDGRCYLSVMSLSPTACQDIFQSNSNTASIKSEELQILMSQAFSDLELPNYIHYRIGLTTAPGPAIANSSSLIWEDGTPAIFQGFTGNPSIPDLVESETFCVYLHSRRNLEWELYLCDSLEISAATLCQLDVNECLAWDNQCSDGCLDLPGTYKCTCPDGKYLNPLERNSCESLCGMTSISTNNDNNTMCVGHRTDVDTWQGSVSRCMSEDASLLSELSARTLCPHVMTNHAVNGRWVSGGGTQIQDGLCPVYIRTHSSQSVEGRDCQTILPYDCERGVPQSYNLSSTCNMTEDGQPKICPDEPVYNNEGFITWFGYPPWFQRMTTVRFHINGRTGRKIRLSLLSVKLRLLSVTECLDSLSILENYGSVQTLKGVYCGDLKNFVVDINSDKATLQLQIGDLSEAMPEFLEVQAYFKDLNCSLDVCASQCPSEPFTGPHGTIVSFNYPSLLPIYFSCTWTVIAKPGWFVHLEFLEFDISCLSLNSLIVGETSNTSSTDSREEHICGGEAGSVISAGDRIVLSLSTGLQQKSTGFSARYTEQDTPGCGFYPSTSQTCESVICTAPSAIIASRNYPLLYQDGLDCEWTVETSVGTYIEIRFTDFDVRSTDALCQDDYLEIVSGIAVTRLCNPNIDKHHWEYKSDRNKITIHFKTNYDLEDGLFFATYVERSFAIPNTSDANTGCMDGWKLINNQCYRHVTVATNIHWYDASHSCKSFSDECSLATIQSQTEMNLIQEYILREGNPEEGTYIGLKWDASRKRQIWDSGLPVTYTDWQVAGSYEGRQPDGGDLEGCSIIDFWSYRETSNWHDTPCAASVTNQFLCQMTAELEVEIAPSPLEINKDSQRSCRDGQFHCSTGECILNVFVCDGKPDCYDESDELNCAKSTDGSCAISEFTCVDGKCIPASFYCDFIDHCTDGSDEYECVYPPCSSDEFQCKDGLCIPKSKQCDLKHDCNDISDEENCAMSSGNFQCFDGKLIPSHRQCDGYRDCSGKNWEDEPQTCDYLQDAFQCDLSSKIQCKNGACTEESNRCIFEYDEYSYLRGCRDASHLMDCELFQCPLDYFKCPHSYCIPERVRCNGDYDCQNGEDELDCESYSCAEGSYKCHGRDNRVCIPQKEVCDGIVHCDQGDDELFCDVSKCFEGCDCSGMSFICSGTNWGPEIAASIPVKAKQLILKGMNTVRRNRRAVNDSALAQEYSIQDALHLDLHQFKFVLHIDFTGNGIDIILDHEFAENMNLRNLILDWNLLTSLSPDTFTGLDNLRYLSLMGNPLTTIAQSPFQPLGELGILDIQSTSLTDVSDEVFSGLLSLKSLYSDKFFFCCLFEQTRELEECLPEAGQFSSCKDLMKSRFLGISLWVLGVAAVLGNSIVIFLRIYRKEIFPNSRRNPTQSILITNLALADFFTGVYMLIIATADLSFRGVYYRYSEVWQTGGLCKFAGFLAVLGSEGSVMFLTVITIDRFQGIVFPLSRRKLRFKSTYTVSLCVWLLAVLISFTPVLPLNYFGVSFYGRSSVCLALPLTRDFLPGWLYSVLIFLVFNLVCFLAMLICYIVIYIKAKQSVGFKTSATAEKQSKLDEQIQMAAKMSFLVLTDMACWMPIIIMGCLALTGTVEIPGDMYAVTAVFILPINSALNPYLYTLLVKAAKRASSSKKSKGQHSSSGVTDVTTLSTVASTGNPNTSSKAPPEMLQNVLNGFRRTRLIIALRISSLQKYTLASLMANSPCTLSDACVRDIEADIRKGLQCLHDNGMVHGNISTSSVIIDGEDENKRAFLLFLSSWKQDNEIFEKMKQKDLDDVYDVIQTFRREDKTVETVEL